jgi:hypothetical protein
LLLGVAGVVSYCQHFLIPLLFLVLSQLARLTKQTDFFPSCLLFTHHQTFSFF